MAVVDLNYSPNQLTMGFFFGTLLGQVTVAAIWTAWGPLTLGWRFPLAWGWLALLLAAMTIQVVTKGGPTLGELFLLFGGLMVGQWLVLQIPLVAMWVAFGVSLRSQEDNVTVFHPRDRQFGIRQLIIITTIIAVVLGVARQVLFWYPIPEEGGIQQAFPVFIFLVLAAITMSLPLAIAALLRKYALHCSILMLFVVGLATFAEGPLVKSFLSGADDKDTLILIWINAFTLAWVLAFALVVRWSGYRLGSAVTTRESSSIPVTP